MRKKIITFIITIQTIFILSINNPLSGLGNPVNSFTLSDAICLTLSNSPEIKIQEKTVEYRDGIRQSAEGEFDMGLGLSTNWQHKESVMTSDVAIPGVLEESKSNTFSADARLYKKLHSGINLELQSALSRTELSTSPVDQSTDPANNSRVDLIITIPLLKGRGSKASEANLNAYTADYEAGVLELRYKVAQSIYKTTAAYYEYLAAYLIFNEREMAEEQSILLISNTKKLIDAGKRPASDLKQLEASLADKRLYKLSAQQSLLNAKQNLGITAGISYEDIGKIPVPDDNFADGDKDTVIKLFNSCDKITKNALIKRPDLAAAKQGLHTGKIMLDAAKRNMQPQVNLRSSIGYSGFREGGIDQALPAYSNNIAGYNASVSLSFEWPFANNYYKGLLKQKKALHDQKLLTLNDLERNIRSDIFTALANLKSSLLQLEEARIAVSSYESAVTDEENKIRMGVSNLFNLITLQDKLISLKIMKISSRKQFSNALAGLRYEMGDLTPSEQGEYLFDVEVLRTLP